MGRRSEGIRPWFDEKAKKWHIRDPDPNAEKAKWSLGFGKEEPGSKARAWEEVAKYKARKEAGGRLQMTRQSTSDITVADVLAFYAERRIEKFVPSRYYPTPVARPHEVGARLKVVLEFFRDLPLDDVSSIRCQDFGMFVHNKEIERARAL